MKNIFVIAAMTAFLTAGAALAQDTPPSSNPDTPATPPSAQAGQTPVPTAGSQAAANEPRIAPGSVIPVQLTKTIDAKKAKTGDEVVAKVTQDMKAQTGAVLMPKDTKVIGHVTEAQVRQKDQKQSELAIAFDQAVVNDQPVQLPMSIQAVIGPENNSAGGSPNPNPGGEPMPSSTGTTATSPMSGRTPMGSGQSLPQAPPQSSEGTTGAPPANSNRPRINAQTQGVIGISNLNLSPNSNAKQGTMLSSEKNNVKLESGTMLLLRVNQ